MPVTANMNSCQPLCMAMQWVPCKHHHGMGWDSHAELHAPHYYCPAQGTMQLVIPPQQFCSQLTVFHPTCCPMCTCCVQVHATIAGRKQLVA